MYNIKGPIFVTGGSRSGKTMMSMLLAAHPDLAIPRQETRFWETQYSRYGDLKIRANLLRCLGAMVMDMVDQSFSHRNEFRPRPHWILNRIAGGQPTYGRLFAAFMEDYAEQSSKQIWGCHSQNFEWHASKIFKIFPKAIFIQMIRDPRDRYAALCQRRAQIRKSLGALGLHTSIWLDSIKTAARNQVFYSGNWKVLSYEGLVNRPEETLSNVFNFIGVSPIPVSAAMEGIQLISDKSGRRPYGPFSSKHIGCYRNLLSVREIAYIQLRAEEEMTSWGYALEDVSLSVLDRLGISAIDRPTGFFRKLGRVAHRGMSLKKMHRTYS